MQDSRLTEIVESMDTDTSLSDASTPSSEVTEGHSEESSAESSSEQSESTETDSTQEQHEPVQTELFDSNVDQSKPNDSSHVDKRNQPNAPARKSYSHKEQMEYAFTKLNSKFAATKHQLADALKQIEELKAAQAKAAEESASRNPQLGPSDFQSQEDYYKYIAKQTLVEQLKSAAETKRKADDDRAAAQQAQDSYNSKALALFKTEAERKDYDAIVGSRMEDGFGDVLNSDPVVAGFINDSDYAPRMVFHFCAIPEDLEKIMAIKDPIDKRWALNSLQSKIMSIISHQPSNSSNPTPKSESKPTQVIGRAGTGASGVGSNPGQSMDDILSSIRQMS